MVAFHERWFVDLLPTAQHDRRANHPVTPYHSWRTSHLGCNRAATAISCSARCAAYSFLQPLQIPSGAADTVDAARARFT